MIRFQSKHLVFLILLFLCVLPIDSPLFADTGERFASHELRHGGGRPDHKGGELGGLAALLFGIANLPVMLSMSIKALANLLPDRTNLNERLKQFNLRQKKHLMKLHYWVNPFALGIAIAHFMSSECSSTAMPELGMGAMLIVSILGLIMTLKLSPPATRRIIFRLHTSPIIAILVFCFLLIGHSVID
jgi:hypothetical protein